MTTVTVTPYIRQRAEQLAQKATTWHRGRAKSNGQGFYLVPGTKPGVAYYSSHVGCTCEGFRRRGVCAHQQACLIVLQRQEAPRIKAAQANYAAFGQCIS